MTGPDCVVMYNLRNTHTHTHAHKTWTVMGTGTKREWEPDTHDPGMNPAACSCFALIYDHLRQPIPAPCIVARTAVANSSRCAVPQQAPRPTGNFSCDCMFWGERGGGYTRQPVGPSVDAAIMTTVLRAQIVWTREVLAREAVRSGAHTRAQTLFGYFVSD